MAPGDGGRGERAGGEALVGVDVRGEEQRQLAQAGELAGEEAIEGLRVGGEHVLAALVDHRAVDVTRVALGLVELRHEGDRHLLLGGDLLGPVLVDHVVVGGLQRGAVVEVDLVLAEVALALRVLDRHPGGRHRVADPADQRLDPRRAEHRVVDVVEVGRLEVAVALVPGVLVGVPEDDELELGAGVRRSSRARRAARAGGAGSGAATRRRPSRPPRGCRPSAARCPRATGSAAGCRSRASSRSRRSRAPTTTSRSPRPCPCRRRRRAGSCSPRRRARPRRRGSAWPSAACPAVAPPCRRCSSSTVSTEPLRIHFADRPGSLGHPTGEDRLIRSGDRTFARQPIPRPTACQDRPDADVAVIGGGVVGAAMAHALAPAESTVTLLEAEAEPALGARAARTPGSSIRASTRDRASSRPS